MKKGLSASRSGGVFGEWDYNEGLKFGVFSYLTSRLTKGQRKPPIEVSISGKSMVGFEGLLVHNNF